MDKEINTKKSETKQGYKKHPMPTALYKKILSELVNLYPKLFIEDKPLLLKLGIHKDIFEDYKLSVTRAELRKFLSFYVNNKQYQELHIKNATRYDLIGQEAGVVTQEQIDSLLKIKEEKKKYIALKKAKKEKAKKDKADKFNQEKYNKSSLTTAHKDSTKESDKFKSYHGNKPKLSLKEKSAS